VERLNIVLDGSGHTIQGNGSGRGIEISNPYGAPIREIYDVTVTNINVKGFDIGIGVYGGWGNIINGVVIAANNVTNNNHGITFSSYSMYSNNTIIGNSITANNRGIDIEMGQEGGSVSGNTIIQNQIANNKIGIYFTWKSSFVFESNQMNNTIFHNNFISNSQNVVNGHELFTPDCINIWDNNGVGNYWSDYNGTDANNDDIGDTPYVIDGNNKDNYPLMAPYKETEPTQLEPFPTTLVIVSVVTVAVVGLGLLVYFKKRKNKAAISAG
jgi:nitrous oxidase accessory protein NosD